MSHIDTSRIDYLLEQRNAADHVVVIGLGSGGFPVLQHLAMSGWANFTLVDPDILEERNLVKHPALRSDLGQPKTAIARRWLLDRNPGVRCETVDADVLALPATHLDELIGGAAVVVSGTDSNAARHFINDQCVRHATPMTVGLVHRGGVGGNVFAYRPGVGGCYTCMETVAEGLGHLPSDDELPVTEDETELLYGLDVRNASAAGLSSDIALIAALHARLTIGELLDRKSGGASTANWISMRIRGDDGLSLGVHHLTLPMIDGCRSCGPIEKSTAEA
ncbi:MULTISPECIES: ThiF family adenylyltransferase [unclassified Streptosporangium]|uniref:ThiF family adenylyltransferase n=1 Tax=unclassified Streptosporangium TaxID=2632669 RepID=UPI002E2A222F|nr:MULTISPECIES: ThiF family adenylyltransferase [unclassified Streptosporangium]